MIYAACVVIGLIIGFCLAFRPDRNSFDETIKVETLREVIKWLAVKLAQGENAEKSHAEYWVEKAFAENKQKEA